MDNEGKRLTELITIMSSIVYKWADDIIAYEKDPTLANGMVSLCSASFISDLMPIKYLLSKDASDIIESAHFSFKNCKSSEGPEDLIKVLKEIRQRN